MASHAACLRSLAVALVAALALARGACAWAHALLEHSAPAADASVQTSPAQIELWFSDDLEPAFSTIRVIDAARRRVDRNDVHVDATDARVLEVSLPVLAPGRYRVVWRALSIDTHAIHGSFAFDVGR